MSCDICLNDRKRTQCLNELKDTYLILFQRNHEYVDDVRICSWCHNTFTKIDKFRKSVLKAQNNLQPQNIYNLEFKKVNNIKTITFHEDVKEEEIFKNNVFDKNIEILVKDDPNTTINKLQDIKEDYSDDDYRPLIKLRTRINKKTPGTIKNELTNILPIINTDSCIILQKDLYPQGKMPKKYQYFLLSDDDIVNEKKCKLDKLQASDVKYKCLLCVQSFPHEDKYTDHTSEHTIKPNTILCKFCHIYIEFDQNKLILHYRKHYLRFKCNLCKYIGRTIKEMRSHDDKLHSDLKCNQCGDVFNSRTSKRRHVSKIHHKHRHQCNECGRFFSTSTTLNIHLDRHKNEYFTCDICGKNIKTRLYFEIHKKRHVKEANGQLNNIVCEICNGIFKYQSSYKKHLERTSNHQDRKQYKCPVCDKLFLDEPSMRKHRDLIHFGIGVTCEVCDRKFASKSNLKKHLKTHEDKSDRTRDHVCHHCGKAFFRKDLLKEHSFIHSDDRPRKCKLCNASFKLKASLYQHTRLVHEKRKFRKSKFKEPPEFDVKWKI